MEKIFKDYTDETKVSVIKNDARKTVVDEVMAFLTERFETVSKVGTNEIAVVVGSAKDEDGFASDVIVVVKPTAKSWYNKAAVPKGDKDGREVVKYDLEEEAGEYEFKLAEKAKKAEKKKK